MIARTKLDRPAPAGPFYFLRFPQRIFRRPVFPSTEPTAAEVTFVCGVLFDIGGVPLFRRVGVMLMLHQLLIFRHFRIILRAFVAAAGWRNRRIAARHDFKILVLGEIKTLRSLSYQITHRLHNSGQLARDRPCRSQGRPFHHDLSARRKSPPKIRWYELLGTLPGTTLTR